MNAEPSACLDLAADLCARYHLTDLQHFLESCQSFAHTEALNVAVFGRFKAGKSSLLNHLCGQPLLPVGVTPVTSVITTIEFGPREKAEIHFLDRRVSQVPAAQIHEYAAEAGNPGNARRVASVHLESPALERYRGVRFVDTPGLDSVFEHNTSASIAWLPNTGLALVAVGVDPPLSRHDVELIRNLRRYTPHISVLLTKVDTLAPEDRAQVERFVRDELAHAGNGGMPVFFYSTRPGFESLREQLDRQLLLPACNGAAEQRAGILRHKSQSLLAECRAYLRVALKAAESVAGDRERLRGSILGQKEALDDARLTLRLIARHAVAGMRTQFEAILLRDEPPVRERLLEALDRDFPEWTHSLASAMERFDAWLRGALTREMAELSAQHRNEFLEPAGRACQRLSQSLQDFRNRLAEQTLATLGVALRTTQVDLPRQDPQPPDIHSGHIFDRNWELLSPVLPMSVFKGVVKRHFQRRLADEVTTNLSRLAAQWEEITSATLRRLETDSIQRLDSFLATVEQLLAASGGGAAGIRADLDRLDALTIMI